MITIEKGLRSVKCDPWSSFGNSLFFSWARRWSDGGAASAIAISSSRTSPRFCSQMSDRAAGNSPSPARTPPSIPWISDEATTSSLSLQRKRNGGRNEFSDRLSLPRCGLSSRLSRLSPTPISYSVRQGHHEAPSTSSRIFLHLVSNLKRILGPWLEFWSYWTKRRLRVWKILSLNLREWSMNSSSILFYSSCFPFQIETRIGLLKIMTEKIYDWQ